MSAGTRNLVILAGIVAVGVVIAIVGFGLGKTTTKPASTVATVAGGAAAGSQEAAQGAGGGGAAVESGPGSASVEPTGAPGAVGLTLGSGGTTLVRPFAATSPWNTTVTDQPVDERSDRFMRLADERVGLIEDGVHQARRVVIRGNKGLYITTTKWSIPIYTTKNGVPTRLVCRQLIVYCGDGSKVPTLSIPADASPKPQYDGPFVVEDLDNGVAYTMFRARRSGSTISYQFLRKWTLNGPGYQVPNSVSTIGSGLPSFAGLLLPDEVRAGKIEHALAIAVPGPARDIYVQPASSTDGVGAPNSIPEGARIRLKPGVKLPKLPGRTNMVAQKALFQALRTYGAIVMGRAGSPTLFAQMNYNWSDPMRGANDRLLAPDGTLLPERDNVRENATPLLRGNELQGIKLSDFEVVEITGRTYSFPALSTTDAAVPPGASGGDQ